MNMKNLVIIPSIILLLVFSWGCEDVLDKQPLDTISDAQLWNDPALIDGYLRECYSQMKFYMDGNDNSHYGHYVNPQTTPNTVADEAINFTRPTWNHFLYWNDSHPYWNYDLIRQLNIFLDKIETAEVADDVKKSRIGEARFLRAFVYFNMVKRYGGVPLILEELELTDPEEKLFPKRAKEEEVYQFIINEIDAITKGNFLKKTLAPSDNGRPSHYAALALKSRAALYAGSIAKFTLEKGLAELVQSDGRVGIPSSKADYFFQASYDASKEIIDNGGFALFESFIDGTKAGYVKNYQQLFLKENNSEIIFAEIFDGPPGRAHSWDMWQCPMGYDGWVKGQFVCVLPEFVDLYQNMDGTPAKALKSFDDGNEYSIDDIFGQRDPRFNASVYTEGTKYQDPVLPNILEFWKQLIALDGSVKTTGVYDNFQVVGFSSRSGGDRLVETPFGVFKYLDELDAYSRSLNSRSKTDYIVFRLGEIFLNHAEAAFELGNTGEAMIYVNSIRKRAGVKALESIDREAIRLERTIELAFEGPRLFDVRRWREGPKYCGKNPYGIIYQLVYKSVKDGGPYRYKIKNTGTIYSGTTDRTWYPKHYYNPITPARIDQNPWKEDKQIGLKENPGWEK
jgi:starch-binding outer membrane protein, SusD/RagB family